MGNSLQKLGEFFAKMRRTIMSKPLFQSPFDVRGFQGLAFKDKYNTECSIQKSSAAMYDAIWLGVSNAKPIIMASNAIKHGIPVTDNTGWVDVPIPEESLISSRMHLTQEQVRQLLPVLQHFADHGELPSYETAQKMAELASMATGDDED